MKQGGQIVLFKFPKTSLEGGKTRPALLLGKLPGDYDDWLTCMVSSKTDHYIPKLDEIIRGEDSDFAQSGLKASSVIRVSRLAVIQGKTLMGATGQISSNRLQRVKNQLVEWISQC